MKPETIKAISTEAYLDEILGAGWTIVGPRNEPEKDLRAAKHFFRRGLEFVPEHLLQAQGFKVVPPSPFTRGHQLMFKDEGQLIRYTRSQYTLTWEKTQIPLYILLKDEEQN